MFVCFLIWENNHIFDGFWYNVIHNQHIVCISDFPNNYSLFCMRRGPFEKLNVAWCFLICFEYWCGPCKWETKPQHKLHWLHIFPLGHPKICRPIALKSIILFISYFRFSLIRNWCEPLSSYYYSWFTVDASGKRWMGVLIGSRKKSVNCYKEASLGNCKSKGKIGRNIIYLQVFLCILKGWPSNKLWYAKKCFCSITVSISRSFPSISQII